MVLEFPPQLVREVLKVARVILEQSAMQARGGKEATHSPPSSRLSRWRWFVSCSWRRDRSERINIADRRRAESREQRGVRTRVSRVYRVWSTNSCDDMDALIFATQGLTRGGLLREVNKHANKTAPKALHSSCLSNKKRKKLLKLKF